MSHEIIPTDKADLPFAYHLFEEAIAFQKRHGYIVWKGYDKNALINDVENGLQYKIVQEGEIIGVFSVCYTDKIIWREKDQGDSIFIHRMAINPKYRDQGQFSRVMKWAIHHAKKRGLNYIRIDTWRDNPKLMAYYQKFGFDFVEYYTTPNTPDLPTQHRKVRLALFQYTL